MTKRLSLLALLGALALLLGGLPAPAEADHHTGIDRSDDADMAKLTGCLNPGEGEGWYTLTTEDGKEVAVMGGKDVGAHAQNHKVELTGKWVGDESHKHFEATGVEHKGVCE